MLIPKIVVTYATFPGVIVHQAAQLIFCRLRRVAVLEICYFQLATPPGYLIYEPPRDFLSSFLIAVGPLVVNSLLCLLFCLPAFIPAWVLRRPEPISCFFLWLGVSIGMHAFPTNAAALWLWKDATVAARRGNLLAIASMPLVGLIWLANLGSIVWLDLVYGLAIGVGLPELLLNKVVFLR